MDGRFFDAGSGSGRIRADAAPGIPRRTPPEVGDGSSAFYYQFHGVARINNQVTEQQDGDTINITYRALAMNGPTGSGYIYWGRRHERSLYVE